MVIKCGSLSEPLSKVPEQLIELILSYKKFDDRLFTYNAARLLNLIFPKLEEQPAFEKSLIQFVNTRDDLTLFLLPIYYVVMMVISPFILYVRS